MYRRYVWLTVTAASSLACSMVLKTNENQCATDDDCKARGALMANAVCREQVCVDREKADGGEKPDAGGVGAWSCLGKVVWEAPAQPQVVVTMNFVDLVAKLPVANLSVRPCAKMDVVCANPLGPAVTTDQNGLATLTLPASFDGYAEVVSSTVADAGSTSIVPTLVFFNPPPNKDLHYGTVPTFTPPALAALAAGHGNTVDPSLGFLFSGAMDCSGKPAAGVSWDPDRILEATRRFYYVDGLPSEAAVSTDATGYGGFINMPTGTIRLFVKIQATGLAVGETSVFVRAGHLSTGFLVPTP
ncbi:MAG TPA: hypothetical protein VKP30_08695 [Polyangiaceae bacterium]|nr:hypothetical protein [Polyangiaceae bacterium]